MSAISGLDDPADARSLALIDLDGDGWQDMAVVNANAPTLRLWRRVPPVGDRSGVISVSLRGGNTAAAPSPSLSNRDGIGARVTVHASGKTLVREVRAGEGFGAQNSLTQLIGVGTAPTVDVAVRWPSGRVQSATAVPAGAHLTAWEARDGPDAVEVEPGRYLAAPR